MHEEMFPHHDPGAAEDEDGEIQEGEVINSDYEVEDSYGIPNEAYAEDMSDESNNEAEAPPLVPLDLEEPEDPEEVQMIDDSDEEWRSSSSISFQLFVK